MKFVCDRCQTKYSIADEKVRGKILKVRCKSCSNIITVREDAGAAPRRRSAPNPAVAPPVARTATAPLVTSTRPATQPFERLLSGGGPPPVPRRPPPPSAPEAPPADDGLAWYIALDGNRTGPFSRRQVVDRVVALPKEADLHVWNEALGSWKPPAHVPAIADDVTARRRPAAPPPPPPFPGAPRRPSPPPVPPLGGAPAPRTSAVHVVAPAIGPGVGLKLPPPSAGPAHARRPTGPIARPSASAMSAVVATAAVPEPSHPVPHGGLDLGFDLGGEPGDGGDPSDLLETPAPEPHMFHGLAGTNGANKSSANLSLAAAAPSAIGEALERSERSDVLSTLNLAGAPAGAVAAPRLLSSEAVVGWQPSVAEGPAARQRNARILVAFFFVIALICAVFMLNVMKKTKSPVVAVPKPAAEPTDPLAGAAAEPNLQAPVPGQPTSVQPGGNDLASRSRNKAHLARPHAPLASAGGALSPTAPPPAAAGAPVAAAPVEDPNARYRDTSRPALAITGGSGFNRPAPTQSDISRVINNNRGGIKNCYQRALLRDNSLTHGKITVQLMIGISGRVKHVSIEGPPQFRTIEPCIKEVVGRWAFPQSSDEYGTEFAYLFQGNE